jgi:NAD+ kinase
MITIDTYLNEVSEFVLGWRIIISTPTGSGILSKLRRSYYPRCKSLVIHLLPLTILLRPLVVPDETEIRLKVSGRDEYYLVSLDSRVTSVRNESVLLTLKKTPFQINMVEIPETFWKHSAANYFGEDKRN